MSSVREQLETIVDLSGQDLTKQRGTNYTNGLSCCVLDNLQFGHLTESLSFVAI